MNEEVTYQVVAARRLNQETMLWQVPSLSLAGQAFLFSVSLGNSSVLSRLMASGLSILISILAIHLMVRHRSLEIADSKWLQSYEETHRPHPKASGTSKQFYVVHKKPVHSHNRFARWLIKRFPPIKWFESSYHIWLIGLNLVGLVAVLVFAITLIHPGLLHASAAIK
jgi:hypothetical protein